MRENFASWKKPEPQDGVMTKWNWVVQGVHGLKLGLYTDIGAFTYIQAEAGVEIGNWVQIGGGCQIYSVSTIDDKSGEVVIGENSCIGANSTILPGITIGKNSIVGAHSLVTKDIPEGVLALGTPARIIRPLTQTEIEKLQTH